MADGIVATGIVVIAAVRDAVDGSPASLLAGDVEDLGRVDPRIAVRHCNSPDRGDLFRMLSNSRIRGRKELRVGARGRY